MKSQLVAARQVRRDNLQVQITATPPYLPRLRLVLGFKPYDRSGSNLSFPLPEASICCTVEDHRSHTWHLAFSSAESVPFTLDA
jgi:hypothetical protein